MTGDKKIVGLWRDSAEIHAADSVAPDEAVAPETAVAPDSEAPAERDWLDISSLDQPETDEASPAATNWRDHIVPALLIFVGIIWTGFALLVATNGLSRSLALADAPMLVATIAMPLTLLALSLIHI